MKNYKLLIFNVLFLVTSYSPITYADSPVRLKYLRYENSSGEKGVTNFAYSESGKNYKAKWQLINGSRYSINYHFLDENDNIIRKYREFSDSITSNNFYKYNDKGQLIEDYFERSDGVKGVVWYKYKDGRKTEAVCRGLNGWFYGIIKYEYVNNQIVKGKIYRDGKEIGHIAYKYSMYDDLIREHWDFGGKWTQTFMYEYESSQNISPESYTYSNPFLPETNVYVVKKENYDWNNEKGGPSFYEYKDNKLVRKVYKYDSLETVTTYEYDEKGLLMKSFRKYSDGRKAEFSYHFNENRQLVRRLFFADNGFEGDETYKYDNNRKLVEAKWNGFDTWLTGIITFQYDENNRLITGNFKGENGFDASLSFESDINQNINKIHWNFTFRKTQTYWFEYEKL